MHTYKKDTRTVVCISNFEDFKDRESNFVQTFSFTDSCTKIKYSFSTRAYCAWNKMNQRCRNFKNTYNGFKSFQDFAEWCQTQPGYKLLDSENRYWALDKDILGLSVDQKIYSTESCCFIPQYLNKVLCASDSIRGDYPLGVSLLKNTGKFMSYCKTTGNGKREIFGYFTTPEEAHLHWQLGKIKAIKNAIHRYESENESSLRVIQALKLRIEILSSDIKLKRETIKI